ncbi:MAG TPA: putative inorganic carbon transporter subunit DabA, partial [Candidatus Binatus sp.]|nr:putative inorganic carbon transporter subunit DabA [Candidatus Binatus sp.]
VHYLAARLWYERELVHQACRQAWSIDGNFDAISTELQKRGNSAGAKFVDQRSHRVTAWKLMELARTLELEPDLLTQSPNETLRILVQWIDSFPEAAHGPVWLEAFEAGYQEELLEKLRFKIDRFNEFSIGQTSAESSGKSGDVADAKIRPQAQAVFCIDVRSEPLRRHLEATGDYETFAFAGFFAVAIRHQALDAHHETDQFPVILKSKNFVREIPRSYQGQFIFRYRHREKLLEAFHTLFYDLKENVVTPYVMVESLGWFYSLPLLGKNILPARYRNIMEWIRRKLVPPVATTLTVDKLTREEVEEMIAAEQRAITRGALQEKFGERNLNLSLERLEFLRRRALDEQSAGEPSPAARSTALSPAEEAEFVDELRRRHGINQGGAFARMERITRTGFTLSEQVFTVETVLRMIGLTRNFARLVLFCGHGSRSENNPFEAALDCGACGGNGGRPNARVIAIMANKPLVREQLAQNGIVIPRDTYFIAGQHNTTTDEVELFDLEDLPPTHRKDLLQFVHDLERAGARNSQERCARFPEIGAPLS